MLRFVTGGESHGPAISAILEGVPAGLRVVLGPINAELRRRQGGFGRSSRQRLERDEIQILGGVIKGRTTGAPVVLQVANRDDKLADKPPLRRPRPGHADMAGVQKYLLDDARPVLERASARESCARVAAGGVLRPLLKELGIEVVGFVDAVGGIRSAAVPFVDAGTLRRRRARSDLYCLDAGAGRAMREAIREAGGRGDTLGGTFTVVALGVPPGLGSYSQWDQRLDGRLAQALLSIPALKGVEVGIGFEAAERRGSEVHDEIFWQKQRSSHGGIYRDTDRAGGIEGGVSNGEALTVRAAMKPIATLRQPLRSVDLRSHREAKAAFERSDVCAVPAASVIGEAMVILTLAAAVLEKFAADTMVELLHSVEFYRSELRRRH